MFSLPRWHLVVVAVAFAASADAREPGVALGVESRGVAETVRAPAATGNGTEGETRSYNLTAPWIEMRFAWTALRVEGGYRPLIYVPLEGAGDPESRVFHEGDLALSSVPLRGLEVRLMETLRGAPLVYGSPEDVPENRVQTSDATADATFRRGRVTTGEIALGARRFDVLDSDQTFAEEDRNGDGVLDPEEDLNENGVRDPDLKLGFVEARVAPRMGRQLTRTTELGVNGFAAMRQFDELVRANHVAFGAGLDARREVQRTLLVELRGQGIRYQFDSGDSFSGYEGSGTLLWRANARTELGSRVSARRSVDAFANEAETAEGALLLGRRLGRAELEVEGRLTRARIRQPGVGDFADVDSGALQTSIAFPLRWGMGMTAGYRFWRGGGGELQWRTSHLVFLGASWK